ncbi:hypothetical protein DEA8626_02420 [Defluviimonas aquaemixtae]|uniref:Uncharacterized protein n=1 Tax=Albidovulum aquaemixtae TaxID=1542388 RepID=A0A2R8BJ30_9RHOB|nr:hypothetical protein [Defluviimonas aquaemixtae]SPH23356.1 hypothetical protein DEA8626_02420 [Defluviimonas aquaemixtae]
MTETASAAVIRSDGVWKTFRDMSRQSMKAVRLQGQAKEEIGMVFQRVSMPHRTVPDNVVVSLVVRGIDCVTGETACQRKDLGSASDRIRVVARGGLLDADLAAKKLREVVRIDINAISTVNGLIAGGEDISDTIGCDADA